MKFKIFILLTLLSLMFFGCDKKMVWDNPADPENMAANDETDEDILAYGSFGEPCYPNETCNKGLSCDTEKNICVECMEEGAKKCSENMLVRLVCIEGEWKTDKECDSKMEFCDEESLTCQSWWLNECGKGDNTSCEDRKTGLVWSRLSDQPMDYKHAIYYCEDFVDHGYDFTDWRLPNIDELRTLIKNCQNTEKGGACKVSDKAECLGGVCYNEECKKGCEENDSGIYSKFGETEWLWSSSSAIDFPVYSWAVTFGNAGVVPFENNNENVLLQVRCVRGTDDSDDTDTIPDNDTSDSGPDSDTTDSTSPCDPNPCIGTAHSTGKCVVSSQGYKCFCSMNYIWNDSKLTCDAETRDEKCTDIPENATWNTASSITQTWDGSSWQPPATSTYNENSSTQYCRFKCKSGYEWNGTQCSTPCNPNPCSSISNSTGVCTVNGTSYICGCSNGYDWNGSKCVISEESACGLAGGTWENDDCNCGEEKTWDPTTQNCEQKVVIISCLDNTEYNPETGKCEPIPCTSNGDCGENKICDETFHCVDVTP